MLQYDFPHRQNPRAHSLPASHPPGLDQIADRPIVGDAIAATDLIHNYIGTSLMKSIELARTADMYQQSQLFILNADSHSPPTMFIEKAKLNLCKGDQAAALSIDAAGARHR